LKKIENATTVTKGTVNRGHKINSIHNFVTNITILFKKYKINNDITELLYLFVSLLIDKYGDDSIGIYNLIEEFMKKQSKLCSNKINVNKIKENITNSSIKHYIEHKQYQKIVPYILEL